MNKSVAIKDDSARSPFAGCAILIGALCVMIFLIGFSVLTLFRQFNEIAKFTAEKPVPVEVTGIENREADMNALAERVEKFRQDLSGDTEVTLALTAEELNLAIASYDHLKELRGTFRVSKIEGETLHAAIAFQLNGKPRLTKDGEQGVVTSDARYLNGTLIARPQLQQREVLLAIDTIDVPGATVPREFIEQMSPYRITERYMADPAIGPAMAKLTSVGIADGKIVFTRTPGITPKNTITKDQVDKASTQLFTVLGVAASLFLAVAGLIIFIGMRAKARKAAES